VTQQRDLEMDADGKRSKIAADEGKLYGGRVSNPKELQSLTEEVAQDKRQLSTVEDKLLEILEQVEELSGQLAASESALAAELKTWNETQESARQKLVEAQAALSTLEGRRKDTAAQIAGSDISTYETIRRQKGGMAVAPVQQRTCQACRVGLTANQEQRARIGAEIILCHSCGRILFVPLT
jgi:predicted  nucleic acid-binding Zn-ribbon protein